MHDSDRLLITIIQSLKTTLNQKPERSTQIEQLLETLKGKKVLFPSDHLVRKIWIEY